MTAASPEDLVPGFRKLPERRFALVLPAADQANSVLTFVGASVHHILDARDKLTKLKTWRDRRLARQVTLIGVRHLAAYAVPVVAEALFDTALAETLVALGDIGFESGIDALDDAREEPDAALKLRHRHTAEVLLRGAYGDYSGAIKEFESTGRAQLGSRPVKDIGAVHEKATAVAVLIAAISHDAGSGPATVKWASRARDHFVSYCDLSLTRARHGLMLNRIGQIAGGSAALLGIAASGGIGGILLAGGGGMAAIEHMNQRIEKHRGAVPRLEAERDALVPVWERLLSE
jgi:hypothetical protein